MLIEDLMLLFLLGVAVLLIGIPVFKLIRAVLPQKERNPLAEAKERLSKARLATEAAKLDKETEKLYEEMYQDALEDDTQHKQEK